MAPIGLDIGARTPEETAVVDLRRDHRAAHRARRPRRCATRRARSTLSHGTKERCHGPRDRRASGPRSRRRRRGSGSRPPRRSPPKACRSRSAAATRTRSKRPPPASAGRVPLVADVSHRGRRGRGSSATPATRSAASTSSCANGGGPPPGQLRDAPTSTPYRDAFELNCLPTIAMCIEAVPAMQAQRWGRVRRDHVDRGAPADRRPDPLEHRARRPHRVPQDAGPRGRGRRRHRELAPARAPRHRAARGALRRRRRRDRGAASRRARSAGPTTSARSRRSCAPSRRRFVTGAAIPVDGGAYTGPALRRPPSAYALDRCTDASSRRDRHGSQPDLGASASLCAPLFVWLLVDDEPTRGGGAARRARRDRLGRRLHRPPLRPGQRARQDPRPGRRPRSCCSSPAVALLVDRAACPLVVGDRSCSPARRVVSVAVLVLARGRRPPHRRAVGRARRAPSR